jgi:hypothetical protein
MALASTDVTCRHEAAFARKDPDSSNTDKSPKHGFLPGSPTLEEDLCPLLPRSQSYGPSLRLSWPRAGDRRRAAVGKSPLPRAASREPHAGTRIVQVSQRDMEMHYYLSQGALNGKTART